MSVLKWSLDDRRTRSDTRVFRTNELPDGRYFVLYPASRPGEPVELDIDDGPNPFQPGSFTLGQGYWFMDSITEGKRKAEEVAAQRFPAWYLAQLGRKKYRRVKKNPSDELPEELKASWLPWHGMTARDSHDHPQVMGMERHKGIYLTEIENFYASIITHRKVWVSNASTLRDGTFSKIFGSKTHSSLRGAVARIEKLAADVVTPAVLLAAQAKKNPRRARKNPTLLVWAVGPTGWYETAEFPGGKFWLPLRPARDETVGLYLNGAVIQVGPSVNELKEWAEQYVMDHFPAWALMRQGQNNPGPARKNPDNKLPGRLKQSWLPWKSEALKGGQDVTGYVAEGAGFRVFIAQMAPETEWGLGGAVFVWSKFGRDQEHHITQRLELTDAADYAEQIVLDRAPPATILVLQARKNPRRTRRNPLSEWTPKAFKESWLPWDETLEPEHIGYNRVASRSVWRVRVAGYRADVWRGAQGEFVISLGYPRSFVSTAAKKAEGAVAKVEAFMTEHVPPAELLALMQGKT
jgi:hypothetical protein